VEHLIRSLVEGEIPGEDEIARIGEQVRTRYENLTAPVTEPYPGIRSMLDDIRFSGMPMAVLTNKPQRAAELTAQQFFPRIVFHAVRGSQPGSPAKPGPEAAIELSAAMGSSPGRTVLVGDSEVDILTGRNAGMITAGVEWGFRSRRELEAAGADLILETPAGVTSFVLGRE
jgi:phosphoglycolate phosphatase